MDGSDIRLIEECLRGEQDAWARLIARYERLIYSVARAVCPEPDDCADIFQHVCLEWYQHLGNLRDIRTLPAWLITVTRRKSFAVLRVKKATSQIDGQLEPSIQPRISLIEQEHSIERTLEQLPERCRRLIALLYFDPDEPSYAEVAQMMDMPVPSVGPTRARCLEKLKRLLSE
jgi:RNA polymerase sigma factor (sigma-70 family)